MQKNSFWNFLGTTTLITWSTMCLILFMFFSGILSYVHGASLADFSTLPEKISGISFPTYLVDILVAILGMAIYGVSCVSLGLRLFSFTPLGNVFDHNSQLWRIGLISIYFLIGNAVNSIILLTLASIGKLAPLHSIILISLGFLSGLSLFRKLFIYKIRHETGSEKIIYALSAAILLISILQTSARISWDSSAIYFSNAKLTAIERHASYFMDNTFVVSVFHSTIQYTAVMQVFGDQSARMISWLFGAINIALGVAIAKHIGASIRAQFILPALLLTSTAFLDLMGDGKVDLISSAYSLAAIYLMAINAKDSPQRKSLFLFSGCFIGFACILRPYNVFLLGMFTLSHILQQLKGGQYPSRKAFQYLGYITLGAVGFAIYHFIINKIVLDSPFAFWSSVTNINPIDGPWDFDPKTIWIYRLLYPVVVTFKNNPASLGNITPLVLVFLPTLTIKNIRKHVIIHKEMSNLAISSGIALFSWVILFFTIVEVRYVIFLWIILFIPIAEIIASALISKLILIKNVATVWIILIMCFTIVRSMFISISTYSPLDTHGNPQCLNSVLCSNLTPINENATRGERVLTLSAYRYYLRTDLFVCSTTVDEYRNLRALSYNDKDLFWLEVYRLGYSYIAYEKGYATGHLGFSEVPFLDPPDWVRISPIIITSEELGIAAYKLEETFNPPATAKTVCQEDKSGAMRIFTQ